MDFNFQVNYLICGCAEEFIDSRMVHTMISTASTKMCDHLKLQTNFRRLFSVGAIPLTLTVGESRTYCPDDPLESNLTV